MIGYSLINIKTFLFDIFLCNGTIDKHMWFIYVLFFIQLFAFLFDKKKWMLIATNFISIFLGIFLQTINHNQIVWSVIYYWFFFCLGRINIYEMLLKIKISIRGVITLLYFGFSIIYVFKVQVIEYKGFIFYLIKMGMGLYGIVAILSVISFFNFNNFSILKYIGQNSFVIYLFHQPFIVSVGVMIIYIFTHSSFLSIAIGTVFGVFVPVLLKRLWERVCKHDKGEFNESKE